MFRYNITRSYPYRWVTPLVIVGFVVFVILFSLLNLVTQGYTLVVQESSNPNATVVDHVWYRHRPTCGTVDLPVGSQFFTNQTGLTYTLTAVWHPSGRGISSDGVSPSLTYYNNVVQNCTVNSVEIDLESLDRQANQIAYSEWGAIVRSFATCAISGVNGTTMFNVTQEYDYVPPSASFSDMYHFLGTNFLERNITSKSSLYWGESMLSMYWASLTKNMADIRANQTTNNQTAIRKGTLYFYPSDEGNANITSLAFYDVDYRFIVDRCQGDYDLISPTTYGQYEDYERIEILVAQASYPNIWAQADTLAKAAYSTVLTDFGDTSNPNNILTDPGLLTYYTSNFTELVRNIANAYPGPAVRPYGTEGSGPLGTTPSVISMKYSCQVPQRKPAGDLFGESELIPVRTRKASADNTFPVTILIADLVLLQALWFLFKHGVNLFFLKRRSDAEHCAGCVAETRANGMYRGMPAEVLHDHKLEEVELEGLRAPTRLHGAGGGRSGNLSQHRLVGRESMDLGYRGYQQS